MSAPLAERLRPRTIDEYIGQEHLVGKNGVFRKFFETGNVPSFILWGPPGVGKTTLAKIVATQLDRPFFTLSAVTSGVKDVREVIESARKQRFFDAKPPFLFIDEIHRFNKSQQDSLLGAVEQGVVTLIGATTENPSFEVISPLLSRCQVYILKSLEDKDLQTLLDRALTTDTELKARQVEVKQTGALFKFSGGDARKLLNILDILAGATEGKLTITDQYVTDCLQQNIALYDKNGEQHYDVISAFIKSVRGSDPNAAIYYLARMLAGGEEPRFLARRLVILASEDIGRTPTHCCWPTPVSTRYTRSACPKRGSRWQKRRSTWPPAPRATRPIWPSTRRCRRSSTTPRTAPCRCTCATPRPS